MTHWLEGLEQWFAQKMQGTARQIAAAPREKTLLEICKQVQEDLRSRIVAQDRGIRAFPYSRIDLCVFARDAEQRDAYEAVLSSEPAFAARLRELLLEEGCRFRELHIELVVTADAHRAAQPQPYTLQCSRAASGAIAQPRPAAALTILRGAAEESEVAIASDRINIGRMREVAARNGAVIRINHVAFKEEETTVAREHAYIHWDAASGRFLLFDHLSGSRGTRIFRSGESIALPKGNTMGTALADGDEIHLASARILFRLLPAS